VPVRRFGADLDQIGPRHFELGTAWPAEPPWLFPIADAASSSYILPTKWQRLGVRK
jgi:hypothetical protein